MQRAQRSGVTYPQAAGVGTRILAQGLQAVRSSETPNLKPPLERAALSHMRPRAGASPVSKHVLLGWRQMTRLIPLAPLVPAPR